MERKIEFRVFDLYEKKVLYDDNIPILAEGLQESIRQFSGQTYELNQFTEVLDRNGTKIYDQDILDIFLISIKKDSDIEHIKISTGLVEYYGGEPWVKYRDQNGEIIILRLNDGDYELEVVGNRLEDRVLLTENNI